MYAKIIRRLEENDPALTAWSFRDNWKTGAAEKRWIQKNGCPKAFDLFFNQMGTECVKQIARALGGICTNSPLRTLDLRYLDNVQVQVLSEITQMLKVNTSLVRLILSGDKIDNEGVEAMAKALESNPATCLQALHLDHNQIAYKGARAIARLLKINTSLRNLTLGDNRIGAEGTQAIAQSLKTNTSLRTLGLGNNRIGVKGAQAIAQLLEINTALREIWLWSNSIGDQGTLVIANAIRNNKDSRLGTLDLGSNEISVEGAKAIGRMLAANPSLKILNLESNPIGSKGIEAIARGVKNNTQLIELNLRSTKIGDEGTKFIAEMLAANPPLKILHLDDNQISPEDLETIYEALKTNTRLTSIDIVPDYEIFEGWGRGDVITENILRRIKKRLDENRLLENKDRNAALMCAVQRGNINAAKLLIREGADIQSVLASSPSNEITTRIIFLHPAYQALMERRKIIYERRNNLGEDEGKNLKKREALDAIERKIAEENSSLKEIHDFIAEQESFITQSTGWTSSWGSPFQASFVTSIPLLKTLQEDIAAALAKIKEHQPLEQLQLNQ